MPKKPSVFRQPGAQHFQLVHRSQRDPLVHDPDAPQRLFKEVGRLNDKQKNGQSLADLERTLQSTGKNLKNPPLRANEGEATLYGVYYDDTEYDYMQHLRGLDVDEQAEAGGRAQMADEAIFVPAPGRGSTGVGNRGAAGRTTVQKDDRDDFARGFFKKGQDTPSLPSSSLYPQQPGGPSTSTSTLPSTVLPSTQERSYQQAIEATRSIPTQLSGFQPDMDPHLRQVLEALEDDAFVDFDEDDDEVEVEVVDMASMRAGAGNKRGAGKKDWFDELLGGGQRGEDEPDLEEEFEFREEGIEDDGRPSWIDPALRSSSTTSAGQEGDEGGDDVEGQTWQDRFRAFKASGGLARPISPPVLHPEERDNDEDEGDEAQSERADTLASMRSFAPTVNGAKNRRRKGGSRAGGSQASGYSMSSSSMFRNKGLTVLDERFDKIERDYEDEGDFDEDDFPESEWMSEAGVEGEDDDNASVASFATATTFTRMLRKQQKQRAEAGETEVSREDFEAIMDDFLDNYEVVGKKMVQVLPGHSGAEKLDSMRRALVGLDLEGNGAVGAQGQGQAGDEDEMGSLAGGTKREADYIRQRYLREDYYAGRKGEEEKMPMLHIVGQGKEDKWDAETILSTYSNLENHPRMIGVARKEKKKPTVAAAPASVPDLDEEAEPSLEDMARSNHGDDGDSDDESVSSDGTVRAEPRAPPVRPRGETKEDKKARKLAVKAERSARRVEKKTRQETFGLERKTQLKGHERAVGSGRASDLTALASGGTGTINVVRL